MHRDEQYTLGCIQEVSLQGSPIKDFIQVCLDVGKCPTRSRILIVLRLHNMWALFLEFPYKWYKYEAVHNHCELVALSHTLFSEE